MRAHYDDARRVLDGMQTAGVDCGTTSLQTREDEGVEKFDAGWEQIAGLLADTLRARRAA